MYNDYTIDNIVESNNDTHQQTYLIPQKASEVKEKRRKSKVHVVMVHRNSDAYDYFITEFRGNKLSIDDYGNVLVPESDYYASHKSK